MRAFAATALVVLMVAGCAPKQQRLEPRQGMIDVPGGKVWYQVVGTGKGTPLLLLHGGPGAPSYYLKPLAALGDDRPVIFYDQLGCGRSPAPADTTLWTVDRFVEEMHAVRTALGLERMHVLGHSWGAILAVEYMQKHADGVQSLVLASPALDLPRWAADAESLRATLPDSTQATILKHEADGSFTSPEYQGAMMEFYHRYVARVDPWPAELDSTLMQLGPSVYPYMCGPSEFTVTGTLKSYNGVDHLKQIHVPILFTAGEYDEARPATVQYFASQAPGSEVAVIANAAHITMYDQPEAYLAKVRDFLRRVDARAK